jgi:hypothetical protein
LATDGLGAVTIRWYNSIVAGNQTATHFPRKADHPSSAFRADAYRRGLRYNIDSEQFGRIAGLMFCRIGFSIAMPPLIGGFCVS